MNKLHNLFAGVLTRAQNCKRPQRGVIFARGDREEEMSTPDVTNYRREESFILRRWYCAAWADELSDQLLPRKILGKPILLFREETGTARAIINLCSHKLAPLHLGKRVGSTVECGYHGLRFDGHGRCVHNPQDPRRVPANASVASFPIVERDGILWIWLGEPAEADESLILDFGYLEASDRKTIRSRIHLEGNYLLLVDNLMDLGHAYYLHQASAGGLSNPHFEIEVGQEGDIVFDRRIARSLPGPPFLTKWLDDVTEGICDAWQDIRWAPAGVLQNRIGAARPGSASAGPERPDNEAVGLIGSHILTPETSTSTHYFCASSRNYALDDPEVDQFWRDWQKNALEKEDSAMVEQIEAMRGDAAALGMRPIPFLSSDASGVRVMRVIDRLLAEETTT